MSEWNPERVSVQQTIARLEATLSASVPRLLELNEGLVSAPPRGMRWSRRQILGHLVDSASNNHHRFVRAQLQPTMYFPRYASDEWVAAQGYGERPWRELVEFWHLYNRHLVHVMKRVPGPALSHVCGVSPDEPSTLQDHIVDYVVHLEHHLEQILSGVS
jgi:hypothetical protein